MKDQIVEIEQLVFIACENNRPFDMTLWKPKKIAKEAADSITTLLGWHDVKDGLPNPGQLVVCKYNNIVNHFPKELPLISSSGISNYHIVRELVNKDGNRWADEGVTHWQEITPPEASNG